LGLSGAKAYKHVLYPLEPLLKVSEPLIKLLETGAELKMLDPIEGARIRRKGRTHKVILLGAACDR
jgi:hypothetical protein